MEPQLVGQRLAALQLNEPKGEPEPDLEKATRRSSSTTRLINSLPLYTSDDFTPHFGLEFDLQVQNYCRTRSNHLTQALAQSGKKNSNTGSRKSSWSSNSSSSTTTATSSRCTYDSVNTPFNKIVRNCKVVVSGDVAVGKTCLVNRFGHDVYSSSYQTTIGVDFDLQRFNILGQPYVLQIWDTAGLERFRCITNSYYRGCQAALLVFDMSNMSTLANVLRWKDEVLSSAKTFDQLASEQSGDQKSCASQDSPLLFLVGTKCDLPLAEATRKFIKEQANKVAASLQAELWFVSAQTGENVPELFHRVAALTFNRCISNEIQRVKFEASTLGASLKEKLIQQQKDLWQQSSKFIKITKRKEGDERRTRCVNIQCTIK